MPEPLAPLVDNARRYARSRVILELSAAAGHVRLAVRDDGPGIADERSFEPGVPESELSIPSRRSISASRNSSLRSRSRDVDQQRLRALIVAGAAVLIALMLLLALLPGRRRAEAPGRAAGQVGSQRPPGSPPQGGGRPFGPEPYGAAVLPTRQERSGAVR